MQIISAWYNWRRRGGNPFSWIGQLEWCRNCKMDVDVEAERGTYADIYVYRKRCKRCGHVTHWGVDLHALRSWNPSIIRTVKRWLCETGANRT